MRITQVLEATAGGTARHLVDVVCGLVGAGHEVSVVCGGRRDPEFPARLRALGAQVRVVDMVRPLDLRRDLGALRALRRALTDWRPDIVHLHSAKAGGLGRLGVPRGPGGPRVVYTPHAFAFLGGGTRYRLIERALAPLLDHLVAVSQSEARLAMEQVGVPPRRVSVVPNGVRLPVLERSPRRGPLRLTAVGRLAPQKAPLELVEIVALAKRTGLEVELQVAGGGPLRGAVARHAQILGVEDRVHLLGHHPEPSVLHASTDVFVTCARYEGLPYALLDAMAAGLPTVAYDAVGIEDALVHERTGLMRPWGDRSGFVAQLRRLARSAEFGARLGARARQEIVERFTLDLQLERLLARYSALCR